MLTEIHIRDFATIQQLDLELNRHATVITGETGAGKSIFIEAIELGLGSRAQTNQIRPGKDRADISLCFDVSDMPAAKVWLEKHDLKNGDDSCIIRRVLTIDGRSRLYINSIPSTLQLAKELGEIVFHLHGQYEQQVLLKAENQRLLLDRFGQLIPLVIKMTELVENYKDLEEKKLKLSLHKEENEKRKSFLQFQLTELSSLGLKKDEWQQLEVEHHKLSHLEDAIKNTELALHLLEEREPNAKSELSEIKKLMLNISAVDEKAKDYMTYLDAALLQLNDLTQELQHYLNRLELDPERLKTVETRISQIFSLARKYKIEPAALSSFFTALENEYNSLENSDENLKAIEEAQKIIYTEYLTVAKKLSESRAKHALIFSKEVTATIRELALPHAEFVVTLEPNLTQKPNLLGFEKINFLIKTNPDHSLQPLQKVISGGELSRLSLAVHLALTHENTPTLIFDEIDTGVSGAVAEKIGKLLRKLGESYQVFCVTHQAQVAIHGHQHLLVKKQIEDNITFTHITSLTLAEKTQEIARMLGGEKLTDKTLAHAKEMLSLTG